MEQNEKTHGLLFIGKRQNIKLPSGREVVIRENTGEDEGILSRMKDLTDNTGILNYLASVVVGEISNDKPDPVKVLPETLKKWPVNDINFMLFKARILSLGEVFKFQFTCPRCKTKTEYEQDLEEYSNVKADCPDNVILYPNGKEEVLSKQLASGKFVQINILNSELQQASLDIPQDSIDINHKLRMRNLQIKINGEWQKVFVFTAFSSRDMVEIRKWVEEIDPTWDPKSHITCSNQKCNEEFHLPLMSNPDFFFPTEI